MIGALLLINLLQVLVTNCLPTSLCPETDVNDLRIMYLDVTANLSALQDGDIPSTEESDELLSKYQLKTQKLLDNFLEKVNEAKVYASSTSQVCLNKLENTALTSQQKITLKLENKHLKVQEKVLSLQGKYTSKISETKLKTSKAVEKCCMSSLGCAAITSCCDIAVNKLNLLKLELLDSINKLQLKNEQTFEAIYQNAVDVCTHLANQLVLCSPPRPTTTSQPITQKTETSTLEISVNTDESVATSEETDEPSNNAKTTLNWNESEEEVTEQSHIPESSSDSVTKTNEGEDDSGNEQTEKCIISSSEPGQGHENPEAHNGVTDKLSNCGYIPQDQ